MAFLVLIMALCPLNTSSVLLPLPTYFNQAMSLSLQSVKPVYIPCDPAHAFKPSLSSARAYLGTHQNDPVKPRMIVLVTPNNPTGTVYSHEEIHDWYFLAKEYKVALILDETYRDFVLGDGNPRGVPHRLFEEPEWRRTAVCVGSFSSMSIVFTRSLTHSPQRLILHRGLQDPRTSIGKYHCCSGTAPTCRNDMRLHASEPTFHSWPIFHPDLTTLVDMRTKTTSNRTCSSPPLPPHRPRELFSATFAPSTSLHVHCQLHPRLASHFVWRILCLRFVSDILSHCFFGIRVETQEVG